MKKTDAHTLQKISEKYFGWHTDHFSRWWEYPWAVNQINIQPGDCILEAGTGKSPIPFYCSNRGAYTYTVDNGDPEEPEEWGFFDYGSLDPKIFSLNESFCQMPWAESGQFDYILSLSVMEHIPKAARLEAWKEFSRTIRDNGRLVLTVDLETDAFTLWNMSRGETVEDLPVHGTLASLLKELHNVGFTLHHYESCPLISERVRVVGLVLVKERKTSPIFVDNPFQTRHKHPNDARLIHPANGPAPFPQGNEVLRGTDWLEGQNLPKVGRLAIGCVADNNEKYLSQAMRLLQSVRMFGGQVSTADFFVCVVDEIDIDSKKHFEHWNGQVRVVPRYSTVHPPSNKLRFFELPELKNYDTVILLDCDTVLVQDPLPLIQGNVFQAKIADLATVPEEVFLRLFNHFNIPFPELRYRTTFEDSPTIWYCNSGVLIVPQALLKDFIPLWITTNNQLINNIELLGDYSFHCDQASLSLAFASLNVPFFELPVTLNFPLHLSEFTSSQAIEYCDPILLHYHDQIDNNGLLLPSEYPGAQKRILLINNQLQHISEQISQPHRNTKDKEESANKITSTLSLAEILTLANTQVSEGDFHGAKETLNMALQKVPDDPWLLITQGNVLFQLSEFEDAIDLFSQAVTLDPGSTIAKLNQASTLIVLDKHIEAEDLLRQILENEPDNSEAIQLMTQIASPQSLQELKSC